MKCTSTGFVNTIFDTHTRQRIYMHLHRFANACWFVSSRWCPAVGWLKQKSGNMINVPIENLEETTYTHRLVIWLSNSIPQYYGISKSPTSWSVLIGQGSWGYKIYHLIWGNYFPIHLKVRPCLGTLTLWPTTVKALYQLYMVLNGLIIP